ncbi:MAG: hypothetical protein ABR577_18100 [Pyrinomonadaceae bacterium]
MKLRAGEPFVKFRNSQVLLVATHLFILIVGVASVFSYIALFPTSFRGYPELTPYNTIAGWVVNEAAPATNVEVQLYVDGRFIADQTADISRPDVVAAGRAKNDKCGFNIPLPLLAHGQHEAQIYVVHKVGTGTYRTLQRLDKPLRFNIP